MSKEKKPINSLYLLKALCAFGVVVLHAPLGAGTYFFREYFEMTVPVFFIITGYFLYSPDLPTASSRCLDTIKKIVPIILICHLVYYPLSPIEGPFRETYMLYFKWLLMGQNPGGGHLWYLTALLQGVLSLFLFIKLTKGKHIWILMSLWGANLAFDNYRELLFGISTSMMAANFIFKAIPCLATGYYIHQHEYKLLSLMRWDRLLVCSVMGIAGAYCLSIIEAAKVFGDILLPILSTLLIVSSFMTCIQHKKFGNNTPTLVYIGQKLSGNIYYWHGLFIMLCTRLFAGYEHVYEAYGALFVFMLSLLFSFLIVKLQDKLGWHILN